MRKNRLLLSVAAIAAAGIGLIQAVPPQEPATLRKANSRPMKTMRLGESKPGKPQSHPRQLPVKGLRTFATGMAAPAPAFAIATDNANLLGTDLDAKTFLTVPLNSATGFTDIYTNDTKLVANSGAVLAGDKYINIEYDSNGYFSATYVYIHNFDGENLSYSDYKFFYDEDEFYCTDLAYDPVTKNIYGYFTEPYESREFFGRLDANYKCQSIAVVEGWNSMACSPSGVLYGINVEGNLYKIDKTNGASTLIGFTGQMPYYQGSAAFGADGKLYWTVFNRNEESMLYEVNTDTGAATLVRNLGGRHIVGLCTVASPAAGIPQAAENVRLDFEDNSLAGNLLFDIPANLADGTPGLGMASWAVSTSGVSIASGQAAYGTTVTVPVSVQQAGEYTFSISLSNEEGAAANTSFTGWIGEDNRTTLVPAFEYTFPSADALDGFTIINANNDNKAWEWYSNRVRIEYNSNKPMDDWLITPPIRLEAGRLYEFSADLSTNSEVERMEIMLGDKANVESMTTTVVPAFEFNTSYNTPNTYKGTVRVTRSGNYHIGFHGCSDEDKYTIYLHSFSFDAGKSSAAPGAPTAMSVTPAADGALSADIRLTAPLTDINGENITDLTKVEISRGDEVIYTASQVEPGQTVSYTDSNVPADGEYTYTATAYNGVGAGAPASATAYIGVRTPAAPAKASFRQTSPGQVTVSWDAVSTDENGNPIAADKITYAVISVINGESAIVAQDITDTSYSYKVCEPDAPQDLIYYGVRAVTSAGFSEATRTDMLPVGKSYEMPFHESFANGAITYVWGTKLLAGYQTKWGIYNSQSTLPAQDDDNGFAGMSGSGVGDSAQLSSGNISLEGAQNPELTFWYFSMGPDGKNTIDVLIDEGSGTLVKKLTVTCGGPAQQWYKARIPLAAYAGKTIRFAFQATLESHTTVAIDNIAIREAIADNLSVATFNVPQSMTPDTDYTLTVGIANNGANAAEGWSVELLLNGEVAATSAGKQLAANAVTTIEFPVRHNVTSPKTLKYQARVVYAADMDDSDNLSAEKAAELKINDFPAPENVTASRSNDNVSLSWNAPTIEAGGSGITQDFESQTHLSQTAPEGWTLLNLDEGKAGGVSDLPLEGIDGFRVGFFTIDFKDASIGGNTTFAAHSGSKFMASMYSYDDNDKPVANDDWMITPRLNGEQQTVSFFARSYSGQYPESFEVLTSSTDTKASSFESVATVKNVPQAWTEYTYNLPAGTRYFAIRCISNDCFLFFVDDVTFIPEEGAELSVAGYNIYRDGVKVNSAPVADTNYTDTGAGTADHIYHISAVFNRGEGAPASVVYKSDSGIADADAGSIAINSMRGAIRVSGAEGMPVIITASDGKVAAGTAAAPAEMRVNLPAGVYVVKAGRKVAKVLVK